MYVFSLSDLNLSGQNFQIYRYGKGCFNTSELNFKITLVSLRHITNPVTFVLLHKLLVGVPAQQEPSEMLQWTKKEKGGGSWGEWKPALKQAINIQIVS